MARTQIAESPVPVGWEQLPVTEGSFRDERMKMNPPVTPRRGRASRSAAEDLPEPIDPQGQEGQGDEPPDHAPVHRGGILP